METPQIELLAPAGDLNRARTAFYFGADAIYLAGKAFGLRARAVNFTTPEMQEIIDYAHQHHKKVYVTVNIFARNADFPDLIKYAQTLDQLGVDAVIVADLGVLQIFKTHTKIPVHISTQANICNAYTAQQYVALGASRVILARELNIKDIKEICAALRGKAEVEVFVHGAMCMAYSGRCLLSCGMTGRSANRGDCAQPCRYQYALQEAKRPGEYYPIESDQYGTYILNSRDLCLIDHLDELVAAGVTSFKIEGRMKSEYYVAGVVNTYRHALDGKPLDYHAELAKIPHRPYTTGFTFDPVPTQYATRAGAEQTYEFAALVKTPTSVIIKNKICPGDTLEILSPTASNGKTFTWQAPTAPTPESEITISCPYPLQPNDILRQPVRSTPTTART